MKKVASLLIVMLLASVNAMAYDDYDWGPSIYGYRDFDIKATSPSSAQGIVYVDQKYGSTSESAKKREVMHTGPGQTSQLKANISCGGSSSYQCRLYAFPKDGYVLGGFVTKADYQAKRTSSTYYIKSSENKTLTNGGLAVLAKVDTLSDPREDPVGTLSYRYSPKEHLEVVAIFKQPVTKTVTTSGDLKQAVTNAQALEAEKLIVKGQVYSADFSFLKSMCNNNNLSRIDLSQASVAEIPENAFSYCKTLVEIKLPARGLGRIGTKAFYDCDCLKKPIIPAGTTLGEQVFDDCLRIKKGL